jgi:hypothetical protein
MSLPARQFGRCGKQDCWTRQQPIIQATRISASCLWRMHTCF